MAVKKSEMYSSLWESCNSLRGGMDSSQYKDYILTLLFVKYVTDKFKGTTYGDIIIPKKGGSFDDMLALIGNKNIGEKMDIIIANLARENNLRGVIDNAHFNDEGKLGKGKEMEDKLCELLCIFRDKMPDFSKNRADDDDIIGDAYEYLMRKFATESGRSKGQFYTPAEVSRILAKVVGIEYARGNDITLYDPACGSGSLLIRAAEVAPINKVSIYGQEKEGTTAGLAKMNLVIHNHAEAVIEGRYSTFSEPKFTNDDGTLKLFDFAVVNPPFSDKNWTHGLKEYGRFDGYDAHPPQKNGDYAWLLHIIKSLKRKGKAAVILPHGVLFRGNAEATIRQNLINKGYIKGIIGLPANLFYGTSIPACIIVIDKENASERDSIFIIDASRDFIKDGNKNRLRERDVYKITTVFNQRMELPKYSRNILYSEIEKNGYNLNIPRYIDGGIVEDLQYIDAHLNGGIPNADLESLLHYWDVFPKLRKKLFKPLPQRKDFAMLTVAKDEVRDAIFGDTEFSAYANAVQKAFDNWKNEVDGKLRTIKKSTKPKRLIAEIAEIIINTFESVNLIDKYDVYETLLSYWNTAMSDDVYMLVEDGYAAIRETEPPTNISTQKEDGSATRRGKETNWDGRFVPKTLVIEMFFGDEQKVIDDIETIIDATQAELDEMIENAEDGSIIIDVLTDKNKLNKTALKNKIDEIRASIITPEITALLALMESQLPKKKEVNAFIRANPLCKKAVTAIGTITVASIKKRVNEIRGTTRVPAEYAEDYAELVMLSEKQELIDERGAILKDFKISLDTKVREKYQRLTNDECLKLLIERKWYRSIENGIFALYDAVSHHIADRVAELAERYELTLSEIDDDVKELECKVKSHLGKMGFV
jgi:type I restriction enzyme M protein